MENLKLIYEKKNDIYKLNRILLDNKIVTLAELSEGRIMTLQELQERFKLEYLIEVKNG